MYTVIFKQIYYNVDFHICDLNVMFSRKTMYFKVFFYLNEYRQLCLIRTDVDPKFLSGLRKIRIIRIGIICIGRDRDLPICPF